jgi:hypothetical protein
MSGVDFASATKKLFCKEFQNDGCQMQGSVCSSFSFILLLVYLILVLHSNHVSFMVAKKEITFSDYFS